MIPVKDDNPTRRVPVVTILLILANVGVYFAVQQGGAIEDQQAQVDALEFNLEYAAIPCEVVERRPLSFDEIRDTFLAGDEQACASDADPSSSETPFRDKNVWLAMVFSMFLHGGLMHLLGNMLFLWIFGNNIEDHLGAVRYLAFYLAAGVAATIAHIAVQPESTVPLVGASGAIAGVMGAYLVWFPNARVLTIIFAFFIFPVRIAAKWWLGFWFVSQFFVNPNEGVAWMAHVGGFVFGVLVGLAVRRSPTARHAVWREQYADVWDAAPRGHGGWDDGRAQGRWR